MDKEVRYLNKMIAGIAAVELLSSSLFVSAQTVTVERLANKPIITAVMLPSENGDDINGPSLVEAPD